MCQTRPGPRCSSYARTNLDQAREQKVQAEARRDTALAAFRACPPNDRAGRETLRAISVEADKQMSEATTNHTLALREYETTPEGMLRLGDAVAQLRAENDTRAADEAMRRLTEARETRAAQIADLRMSVAHAQRLANPRVDEAAALDQADALVNEMSKELDRCSAEYQAAHYEFKQFGERAAEATAREREATERCASAREATKRAATFAAEEAKRLYVEAGVSERFAGFYAADMVEASTVPVPPASATAAAGVPARALAMKVKRNGPDRPKTIAAKEAADFDGRFVAANTELIQSIQTMRVAEADLETVRSSVSRSVHNDRQAALSAASIARYATEDAQNDLDRACKRRDGLRARIGSGLGPEPVSTVSMSQVRDEIVRNPDGTTNAYVYNGPSEGFPYGRYIPAVDVAIVHGTQPANALVLENGRKAWLHAHYSRNTRGAGEERTGYQQVVIVAPQEGAVPLRAEGAESAGFYTFVDSTD